MVKSYSQKADAIFKALEKNPNASATDIYNRYKGTDLGMRKTDSLELTKSIKEQLKAKADFMGKVENSNMKPATKQKLNKLAKQQAYKYAKNTTKRGKTENKKGIVYGKVQALDARTFNRRLPNANNFYDFY